MGEVGQPTERQHGIKGLLQIQEILGNSHMLKSTVHCSRETDDVGKKVPSVPKRIRGAQMQRIQGNCLSHDREEEGDAGGRRRCICVSGNGKKPSDGFCCLSQVRSKTASSEQGIGDKFDASGEILTHSQCRAGQRACWK